MADNKPEDPVREEDPVVDAFQLGSSPRSPEDDRYRDAVLRQVRALSEDNQRLFQSAVRSERRFRTLAKAVWRIQEDERRRLARELHDGIGQALTALVNQIQRILDDADRQENLGLAKRLGVALDITRGALRETREMSRLLRPTLLDDLGLHAALSWLARTLGEGASIRIEYHSRLGDRRLDPDVETLLYRVTQEALTNVVRHSGAQHATVSLTPVPGAMVLRVVDDGCGFDAEMMSDPRQAEVSSGLRGMRDRAELFGGRLDIQSAPGEGTSVRLHLPVDSSDQASDQNS